MRRLLALCTLATLAPGQPPPPPWLPVHGKYRNQAGYGFSLTLPPGLTGHRAPPPAPSHGLTVHLGSAANRLSISGIYNAAEYPSPRAALQPLVASRQREAASCSAPEYRTTTLGGLPATELLLHYVERHTGAPRLARSLAALRPAVSPGTTGILYELTLDTTASRAEPDTAAFQAIRTSFRLEPLPAPPSAHVK